MCDLNRDLNQKRFKSQMIFRSLGITLCSHLLYANVAQATPQQLPIVCNFVNCFTQFTMIFIVFQIMHFD